MPSRRPLWIVIAVVAMLGTALAISAQLRVSRPSDDTIDLAAGAPDPDRDPIEADLAWALDLINGNEVSVEELEARLSPIMLDVVPIQVLRSETERLALDGPYQLHGIDMFAGGVAGALITSRSGDVFGLQVAVDPNDPDRRLTLLGVSPADEVQRGPFDATDFALHLGAGLALVLAGAIVANVHPSRATTIDDRVGILLAAAGLIWMAQLLELSSNSILFTAGLIAGPAAAVLLAVILVAATAQRRRPGPVGLVVVMAAAAALVLAVLAPAALDTEAIGLPDHLLSDTHDGDEALRWSRWSSIAALIAVAAVIVQLAGRMVQASGSRRRGDAPMTLGGTAGALAVAIPAVGMARGGTLDLSQSPVISAGAVAAAVGLVGSALWQRYDLDDIATLAATADDGAELGPLLARALGDPTAELYVWDDTAKVHRHHAGGDTQAPFDGTSLDTNRAVTQIGAGDQPLGLIVHDKAVLNDPDRLSAATGVAQLSLENERLYAEVESQLDDVRASRARILEATEVGRRRIERDLHDGAQQHLLSILLNLRLGRDRFEGADPEFDQFLATVTEDLSSAVSELRELSRGLHPAILDRGVLAAAQSLAETAPLPVTVTAEGGTHRCSKQTEHAAYFVMTEALANTSRHAGATHVDIHIDCADDRLRVSVRDDGRGGAALGSGTGLQNLEDRVVAIGGSFGLVSPPDHGTRVDVVMPCGEVSAP